MTKTTYDEFQQSILSTGGYDTAPDHRAAKTRRPSGWVTFIFTFLAMRVFPMCAIWDFFRKLTTRAWGKMCFSTVTTPEKFGMNIHVEGFQARNACKGPVVYLCNHMSTFETVALPPILLCWDDFSYVAKESLAHLPGLEHAAYIMGMVGIGRKNPKEDLLKIYQVGGERLGGGHSFLIFPQGTRQEVFDRKHFSSIGAKLAEKAGAAIVPIVVDTRCMPTRKTGLFRKALKDFGPIDTSKDIRFAAGPVIPPGKAREMQEAAFDWMAGKLESWGLPVVR